ncbi:MAG: amino acid ABC transporter permease [Thermoleophilia bacterium]
MTTAPDRRAAREAARRSRARRGVVIATVSSVVVIGGLALLIVNAPGWEDVKETFFSPEAFRTSFPEVLRGFWLDVKLFMIVEAIVLVLGLGVALIRVTRAPAIFPFRLLATIFTDVMRGVPVILVVYLIGFGIPALGIAPEWLVQDPVILGGIGLTLCYTAYVAEVYRAGLDSVHPSQRAAALAVGLTETQALRHVIVPQAVRRVVPPLLNDFISLQKDVALISILGPLEAFRVAQIEAARDFNYTPLIAAALLYLAVTVPLARIVDHQQARARRRQGHAVGA